MSKYNKICRACKCSLNKAYLYYVSSTTNYLCEKCASVYEKIWWYMFNENI